MDFIQNQDSENKIILDEAKKNKRLKLHSFHRYYGKLIPAIPQAYIRKFTQEGDLVFDPFVGSGTTALEARANNRNFIGVEVNPLSVLISRAKTNTYDKETLNKLYEFIEEYIYNNDISVDEKDLPFVINRDHWFKEEVQKDLILIEKAIEESLKLDVVNDKKIYSDFLYGVLSAIVKLVSNADTRHVFPGVSKRVRQLELEGKNNKDAKASFLRGLRKRINDALEIPDTDSDIKIYESDITEIDLSDYDKKVDLIVTNPPYISSVRYAETMKLELYWMEVIKSQTEYSDLSNQIIGNDRILKEDYQDLYLTKYDFINDIISEMYNKDKKNAKVISDFFNLMDIVVEKMYNILKPGGVVVMKISDSRIRKTRIETGRLLTDIAKSKGFELFDLFDDKISKNSRSLTTARNVYSDIILHDNIVFWRKPDEK